MAKLTAIDSLNIIGYYGEMDLSLAEKKVRIVMAEQLHGVVSKYYAAAQTILADEKTSKRKKTLLLAAAVLSLKNAYLSIVNKYYLPYINAAGSGDGEPYSAAPSWLQRRALDFSTWVTQTAQNEPGVAFSQSHAAVVTRTEVNAAFNLCAMDAAYERGMRYKTWKTFGDAHVRPSHNAVNGKRIPIDQPFTVGRYQMMFPLDDSLGAGAEEIVNCRCVLEFDDGKHLTKSDERDIIKEQSRKPITEITDKAVAKVPKVSVSGYSDEQCAFIQGQHKELLKFARTNNSGKEVAFVFRSDLSDKTPYMGTDDRLVLGSALLGKGNNIFVMHNHPRNSSYSATDIAFFLSEENIKHLSIVKNNGLVEVLTKSEKYDASVLTLDFKRIVKKTVKTGSDKEFSVAVQKLLEKHSQEGGMLEWKR